ncbi:MAG: hypothetical protein U0237_06450 [Thermoleophilia bacterium]
MNSGVYPSPKEGALPFMAAVLGTVIAVIALPIVLLAAGPLSGWLLGIGLWLGNWSLSLFTSKVSLSTSPTAAVGVAGISLMARAWITAIILFVIALRVSEDMAITAAFVFLAAFTFDLMGRALLFAMNERKSPSTGATTDS